MNFRIFVEKKEDFRVESLNLLNDLKNNLSIKNLENIRVVNLYDVFNIDENNLNKLKNTVFAEKNVDDLFLNIEDVLTGEENYKFAVEFLPGQYDQRADSAIQCISLLVENSENISVNSGKLLLFYGNISDDDINKIKKYYINEVEMREKNINVLEQIVEKENTDKAIVYNGFINKNKEEIAKFKNELELAMTVNDLLFIQEYFKNEEKRDPKEAEIKVLDTYWSDHCRHTTFETIIDDVKIENDIYRQIIENTLKSYISSREYVHAGKIENKPMTLMDLATIFGKEQRKRGNLADLEVSDEINACSLYIDVPIKGKIEKWILQFKNETHNHPTEIEPFGGASTCLGGAIRDPLSGRTYVYQGVRISGSGDPTEKIEDTMAGKLPQKVITQKAAHGFSSYGNQIGMATTFVNEIYHEGYKAKRMELGLVVGAAPAENIIREKPENGDIVILLGGRTGRDGIGGATGSSKEHTTESFEKSGSEVQKGNAIVERKIQRLFRNKNVTKLIKKCNDFGAGGVSVAIGELADGLEIDLNKVRVKYIGLTGTELAISESQERMAVVIAEKDKDAFINYAKEENLEAYQVATVNDSNRLVMRYNDEIIVDISRDFLNTNGAKSNTKVVIENSDKIDYNRNVKGETLKDKFINNLKDLNVTSQRGLMESFDSSIGSTTVLMPYGGKYQLTPADVSVQKISVENGETDIASMVAYGYNPNLAKQITFHGGALAVIESIAKIVASGGNYKNIRFTFQEYFERLGNDPKKWGKPLSSLLGTLYVQKYFGLPSIGGKDSMSGTFHELTVPPTLVSFAVSVVDSENVISSEFKQKGNKVYLIKTDYDENDLPNLTEFEKNIDFISEMIKNKKILSASAVKTGGIAESIAKMSFGNKLGINCEFRSDVISENDLFKTNYGQFIIETADSVEFENAILLGTITDDKIIKIFDNEWEIDELIENWEKTLKLVFPISDDEKEKKGSNLNLVKSSTNDLNKNNNIVYKYSGKSIVKPRVFIPVFPGTNCEYDLQRVFDKEGGNSNIKVFNNLSPIAIEESINDFVKEIDNSQIFMLSGGFSSGDEPDGSAKFIVAVLKNEKIRNAVHNLLKRDGLILGICNGFQALIKSGLLPYGEIRELEDNSPTLTHNLIDKHMSKIVNTKIVTNQSPWLNSFEINEIHTIPMSHGEGRLVITEEDYKKLLENNQVATQYVDLNGNASMITEYNPNGSYYAIEGLLACDGRILGKMAHSERVGKNLYKNIIGNKEQNIFKNGIKYFL